MLRFSTHEQCIALSGLFRGKLCEQLLSRPGRILQSNQQIYNVGDAAESVFFLRRGVIKLTVTSEDGKEVILGIHKANDIIGELCLCDGIRNEMATTMEPSEVVEITLNDFINQLQDNKETLNNFLVLVCQRLSNTHQTISELSFDLLPRRLAKTLLRLSDELGHETENGIELNNHITQEELAQMVSARREIVSTILCQWREFGVLNYSRKGKMIINKHKLNAYAGHSNGHPLTP